MIAGSESVFNGSAFATEAAASPLDEYGMYPTFFSRALDSARAEVNPQVFFNWSLMGQLQFWRARETGNFDLYKTAGQSFWQNIAILDKNPGESVTGFCDNFLNLLNYSGTPE